MNTTRRATLLGLTATAAGRASRHHGHCQAGHAQRARDSPPAQGAPAAHHPRRQQCRGGGPQSLTGRRPSVDRSVARPRGRHRTPTGRRLACGQQAFDGGLAAALVGLDGAWMDRKSVRQPGF